MAYTAHVTPKRPKKNAVTMTPGNKPITGRKKEMVKNYEGKYVFKLSPMKQLERFLVLGCEGGSYYANEKTLTQQNAQVIYALLDMGEGRNVVDMIVDISTKGRGIKNDTTLFALALCVAHGDKDTKERATSAITKVARTGTHLFQFMEMLKDINVAWPRSLRNGIAKYYTEKDADKLAYQLVKYRQRGGWSHRDVLRLSHPKVEKKSIHNQLFNYAVGREDYKKNLKKMPAIFQGFLKAQEAEDAKSLVKIISEYGLTWEMIPTEAHKEAKVWEALLPNLPLTALVRNLGRLSKLGLIDTNFKVNTDYVAAKLSDPETVKKSKIHPFTLLLASKVYGNGKGVKGDMNWKTCSKIEAALETAFELSFQNVEAVNKNFFLAVDVSPSMETTINNSVISSMEAAAAMALIRLRAEPNTVVYGFSGTSNIKPLNLSQKSTLKDVLNAFRVASKGWGGTDISLPFSIAQREKYPIDIFEVYTDNDTNSNRVHPSEALKIYRKSSKRDAKLSVFAFASTGFTVADPADGGMMDFVGLDPAGPAAANEFYKM